MKKILFSISLALCAVQLLATVRTVSNDPAGGAQYSTLQAAFNASTNGDTLLIEGTNGNYSISGEWSKSLTVIGIGFNPSKQLPRRTKFSGSVTTIAAAGSGSRFYGIEYMSGLTLGFAAAVSNVLFEDCKFNANGSFDIGGGTTATNFTFRNCLFHGEFRASYGNNILFANCILDSRLHNGTVANTISSYIFDHCLFLYSGGAPIQDVHNTLVNNSIFMNHASIESNCAGNVYQNNISRLGGFPAGVMNTNNQSNTNPLLTTYTFGQAYSTSHNYALQAASTGVGAANDGTDIGLHGGSSGFHETGEVQIVPIMREVNVYNTTVPSGGTLNVHINATKPND